MHLYASVQALDLRDLAAGRPRRRV